MKAPIYCLAATMLLAASEARAQGCEHGDSSIAGQRAIPGTVGYGLAWGAFEKSGNIYGAASAAETKILPGLRKGTTAFDLTSQGTLGAVRVPVCGDTFENEDPGIGTPGMGKVDLGTASLGFGRRFGSLSLFFVGSSVYKGLREEGETWARFGSAFGLPLVGALISPIAPLKRRVTTEQIAISIDFIAGAEFTTPVVNVAAGYLASQGLYAGVTENKLKAFVTGVLSDSVAEIPYLRLGFVTLDALVGDDVADTIGSTSIFARQLQYGPVPRSSVPRDDIGAEPTEHFNLQTGHIEQYGIGGRVDILFAMARTPEPQLYEASVAYHSVGYLPLPIFQGQSEARRASKDSSLAGYKLLLGVVRLPDLWFYGVKGGYVLRASAEVGLNARTAEGGFGSSLGLSYNNADTLAVFPFAYNSGQFNMTINSVF